MPWMRRALAAGLAHRQTLLLGGLVAYAAVGLALPRDSARRRAYFRPLTATLAGVLTVIGFGVSTVQDWRAAAAGGRTQAWERAMEALRLFLQESGLEDEWKETLQSQRLLPA
jgi:hypothetical protein